MSEIEPTDEDRAKASSLSGCSAGLTAVALAEARSEGRAEVAAELEALIQDVDAAHIPILDKIRALIEATS